MIGSMFLLAVFLPYVASTNCDPYWLLFYESCYFFGKTLHTWQEAKTMCKQLRSNLASLQGKEEEAVLVTGLKAMLMSSAWLGAYVNGKYDYWAWAQDEKDITYENWKNRDPYGRKYVVSCLTLARERNGSYAWIDDSCSAKHGFICERDLNYPPVS